MYAPAILFACLDRMDLLGIFAGISLVAILTINFDSLKSISAFGIKAELKETIDKAHITMEQLDAKIREARPEQVSLSEGDWTKKDNKRSDEDKK